MFSFFTGVGREKFSISSQIFFYGRNFISYFMGVRFFLRTIFFSFFTAAGLFLTGRLFFPYFKGVGRIERMIFFSFFIRKIPVRCNG